MESRRDGLSVNKPLIIIGLSRDLIVELFIALSGRHLLVLAVI